MNHFICRNFRRISFPCPIRLSCFDPVRIRFINEPAAMLPNPLKKSTDKYVYTLGALAVPLNRLL
jgi:hypothetical protein